jgi:hypothetical protein
MHADSLNQIAILERQNRLLRLLVILSTIFSIAAISIVLLNPTHHTLEAQQFVLKDLTGTVRGTFDVTREGGAAFHLYGPRGKDLVAIGAPANGSPFIVLAESGARMAIIDEHDRPI